MIRHGESIRYLYLILPKKSIKKKENRYGYIGVEK